MSMTYKATIELRCWKEHACIECGSKYRYRITCKKTGQASTEEAAAEAARKDLLAAVQDEAEMHPCPSCGRYQPDMVGARRTRGHGGFVLVTLVGLATVLIITSAEFITLNLGSWIAFSFCAFAAAGHLIVDLQDPNKNRDSNQRLAERRIQSGTVRLTDRRDPDRATVAPEPNWSAGHRLTYLMLGLAVMAPALPEAVRAIKGWPLNPQWFPPVAGPGDSTYVYFPDRISSVKGYWYGGATAQLANAQELGIESLTVAATTNRDMWADKISAKSSADTSTLWVRIHLPNAPEVAGKELKLNLALNVMYPRRVEGRFNLYEDNREQYAHTFTLTAAAPRAGRTYDTLWWAGVAGGGGLVLILSLVLAGATWRQRRRAMPTSVYPLEDDAPPAR